MTTAIRRLRHRWFLWVNYAPHRWNAPPHVHGPLSWRPEPRCTACGHRVAAPEAGPRPRQTREHLRSPWTWPLAAFEITGRAEARWRGWLLRTGRLPR